MTRKSRRTFLSTSSAWLGLAGISNFSRLHADDGQPLDVSLSADIEPLVRLIEMTPREKSIGMMIGESRKGTTKNQFVAAMFVAAGRMKVSPHHVYMIADAWRALKPGESARCHVPQLGLCIIVNGSV